MNLDLLTALMAFAFVTSITPGPNNLMLMSSGASFGVKRTIPHILGVALGFVFMLIVVGFGIMQLFDRYPVSYSILNYGCAVYLIYLAAKIATATATSEQGEDTQGRDPMSFFQAVLFQWINPKAWTMALTAVTLYAPNRSIESLLIVATIFGIINLPSVGIWAVLGQQLSRVLTNSFRFKLFNLSMAILLLLSLYPAFV